MSNSNTFQIKKFKLEMMCENPMIVISGKRKTGKSWLCKQILYHVNTPGNIIISPNEGTYDFYHDVCSHVYVHREYSEEILKNLFFRQKIMRLRKKSSIKSGISILFDRCFKSNELLSLLNNKNDNKNKDEDKSIKDLFFNGRSRQITTIIEMQCPLIRSKTSNPSNIPPEFIDNVDYIFLFADDCFHNQQKLYEQYAGVFPSVDIFRQVFAELTKNHCCMVIINDSNIENIWDKVFWFKAKDLSKVNIHKKPKKKKKSKKKKSKKKSKNKDNKYEYVDEEDYEIIQKDLHKDNNNSNYNILDWVVNIF